MRQKCEGQVCEGQECECDFSAIGQNSEVIQIERSRSFCLQDGVFFFFLFLSQAAFTRIQISGYLDIRISEIRISSGRLHVSDRNVFGVYTCPDIRMHYTRHTRYV